VKSTFLFVAQKGVHQPVEPPHRVHVFTRLAHLQFVRHQLARPVVVAHEHYEQKPERVCLPSLELVVAVNAQEVRPLREVLQKVPELLRGGVRDPTQDIDADLKHVVVVRLKPRVVRDTVHVRVRPPSFKVPRVVPVTKRNLKNTKFIHHMAKQ
jgi:hypothetical protein